MLRTLRHIALDRAEARDAVAVGVVLGPLIGITLWALDASVGRTSVDGWHQRGLAQMSVHFVKLAFGAVFLMGFSLILRRGHERRDYRGVLGIFWISLLALAIAFAYRMQEGWVGYHLARSCTILLLVTAGALIVRRLNNRITPL